MIQLPLWMTPSVIILSALGLVKWLKKQTRFGVAVLLWVVIPFLLMVPYYRDVRYLLVIAPAYAMMTAASVSLARRRRTRATLTALTLSSLVIFLAIAVPISHQVYGGIDDASYQLTRLGLAEKKVMSNVPALVYYLPHLQLVDLSPTDPASSIYQQLRDQRIDAVVVLHNARGTWPDVSNMTIQAIRSQFRGYISGGPSGFSWYELFYDPNP
jgi:hypothetical protein